MWSSQKFELIPIKNINAIDINLLKGIDHTKSILIENTSQFSDGYPANNVLLWGARGMGKSSLVKSGNSFFNSEIVIDLISPT